MCGIAGQVTFGGGGLTERLDHALAVMASRGPDGKGHWSDGTCALGHRRLAIIDLSDAGSQPMQRGHLVIAFNGEIYNHAELRQELIRLGHEFSSRSDTEVLLKGWQQWDAALLPRLSGMFAFAIWNTQSRELVLATDRFGKKPLVYSHARGSFSFASGLDALISIADISKEIDREALKLYFALRFIPAPWTIYRAARKLPPGTLAKFSATGLSLRRWDDGPNAAGPKFSDRAEAIAALREAFDLAVSRRLVADVPVGCFLSGGLDSALVCASLTAQGHKVRSYSVGFSASSSYYEERPAARRVANFLGLAHSEIEIGPNDARECIDDVFAACDEPFADSSALPVYLLARETRRHVTVALSGDGADEVFAGYRKYQGELLVEKWLKLPSTVRNGLGSMLQRMPEGKEAPLLEMLRRARRFVAGAIADPLERHARWSCMISEGELDALLVSPEPQIRVPNLMADVARFDSDDFINRMLSIEQRMGLSGDMLRKVDLMSMANSLEVRCPFLDRDLTDVAAAIPGDWKLHWGRGKAILRDAFSDRLPRETLRRPKRGFEMPVAEWLRSDLFERVRAASDSEHLRRQGFIRPEPVQRWVEDLVSRKRDTSWQLWALLAFQSWSERVGARF